MANSIEYEPLSLDENTDLKVPISPKVPDSCTVDVTNPDTEDIIIERTSHGDEAFLREQHKLTELYRQVPKQTFVSQLLKDNASNEERLEHIRSLFFDNLKEYADFPYNYQVELKRRVDTRKGERLVVKLANDIYTLVSVMDGEDYSCLKDMISTTKGRQSSASHSNVLKSNTCNCSAELSMLKDDMSSVQADILLLKQSLHAIEKHRQDQMKTVSSTLNTIKTDIANCSNHIASCYNEVGSNISHLNRTVYELNNVIQLIVHKVSSLEVRLANNVTSSICKSTEIISTPNNKMANSNNPSTIQTSPCFTATVYNPNNKGVDVAYTPNTECTNLSPPAVERQRRESSFDDNSVNIPVKTNSRSSRNSLDRESDPNKSNTPKNKHVPIKCSTINQDTRDEDIRPIPVRVESRQNTQPVKDTPDPEGFEQYVKRRSKRFFVNGFLNIVTEEKFASLVSRRGPKVSMVRIFPVRNSEDRVIIRLNVEADENADLVLEDGFWPRGVVKPWLSRSAMKRQRYTRHRGTRDAISYDQNNDNNHHDGSRHNFNQEDYNFEHTNRYDSLRDNVD